MKIIHTVKVSNRKPQRARTTKTAEQVRAALLAAAAKLFARQGFSEVSIADIAGEAGVATGTFYRSFPTKDDVLVQLRCTVLDELHTTIVGAAPDPPTEPAHWWHLADEVIGATVRFWFVDRDRSLVVLRGGLTDDAVPVQAALATSFALAIQLGKDIGAVRADTDAALAASFLMHGIFGLIYDTIVNGQKTDPGSLVTAATSLTHHLLKPAPKAEPPDRRP
jgi:AcrR family transcriptional regulator